MRFPVTASCGLTVFLGWVLVHPVSLVPAKAADPLLPFDPAVICRYSLEPLPRSISILQGGRFWLGYDLERAKVFKAWEKPAEGTGLMVNGFTRKAQGALRYEDPTDATWRLKAGDREQACLVRYLGITQLSEGFELRWSLQAGNQPPMQLTERVPLHPAQPEAGGIQRKLRVTGLPPGGVLLAPPGMQKHWVIDGHAFTVLDGQEWITLKEK